MLSIGFAKQRSLTSQPDNAQCFTELIVCFSKEILTVGYLSFRLWVISETDRGSGAKREDLYETLT